MLTLTILHITGIFLFIICFIAFVFVTRGRRPISNILAWLFFMFLLPYIGIPLFFILGQRKLGWIVDKKRLLFNKRDNELHKPNKPLEHLLNTFGVLPPTNNNTIRLLSDGVDAYQTIMKKIEQAKDSILISTYLINNDAVGCAVVQALTEKAKQGLQVCLLLDTIGSLFKFPHRKLRPLRNAGGCVRYIMPLLHSPFRGRVNLRDHRKIMIFDGRDAIMGGMNLAMDYMGPTADSKRWTDLSMLIEGNAVSDLLSVFESDWKFAATNSEFKSYTRPTLQQPAAGKAILQMVASGPDTIGDTLYDAVISSIYAAKKSITIITPYFIIDNALQKAFMIAIRRGVKVTLIIPKVSNHRIPDLVRAISIRKLRDEGAYVHRYNKMIHAKSMIFDESVAIVGSANLDLRSLLLNFEISCFMYSKPEIDKVIQWANNLLADSSSHFEKTSLTRMLLEDAAQLVKPLL